MNRVAHVFATSPVLLAVVHPIGRDQALASIAAAQRGGAHGVFLIDQGLDEAAVLALVLEARARSPELWIGVNLLSRRPAEALACALDACAGRIDGIWSDNAGVDDVAVSRDADDLLATRRTRGWTGLYFGGVAFKYQREVAFGDLGATAARAAAYMDVVCTSGPGTGKAADIAKVRAMRAAMGDAALALASGVTAANVASYVSDVAAFLVGTGIEARFGVIDEAKVRALVSAMRA